MNTGYSKCKRCGNYYKDDEKHPGHPELHQCEPSYDLRKSYKKRCDEVILKRGVENK